MDELRRKFQEKFPDRMTELEAFLFHALSHIEVVSTPEVEAADEGKLRDPKDRPILRAALNAHADLFLTGDKDFLESAVTDPRIISVADFLERQRNGAQQRHPGGEGICPLKAGKPGSANWTRRPASDISTHKCPACYPLRKSLRQRDPLQPIAAALFQFKLNYVFRTSFLYPPVIK